MKNLIICIGTLVVLSVFATGQTSESNNKLPTLRQIKEVTLAPSYSCRSSEEFAKGYVNTALYLSDFGGPDLLFNGACGSVDYFEAATAGDDMSLVADLGTGISLEELSAHRAFNVAEVFSFEKYSKFAKAVTVQPDHTYAVLMWFTCAGTANRVPKPRISPVTIEIFAIIVTSPPQRSLANRLLSLRTCARL